MSNTECRSETEILSLPKGRIPSEEKPVGGVFTHERLSRLLIGISILVGLAIGYLVTPWGYLILIGVALNLIQFAFTGCCKVKSMLDRLAIPYERPPEHLIVDQKTGMKHRPFSRAVHSRELQVEQQGGLLSPQRCFCAQREEG